MSKSFFLLLAFIGAINVAPAVCEYVCPGSPSFVRAWCQMRTEFADKKCDELYDSLREIVVRWGDGGPNNGGIYSIRDENNDDDKSLLEVSRLTGDKMFTDFINFALEQDGDICNVRGCSESQVFSIADFSTNYCNIWNVLEAAGANFDETEAETSVGAGSDVTNCKK